MDDDVLLRFLGHGLIDVGGDDTKLEKLQATAKELAAALAASPARVVPGTLLAVDPLAAEDEPLVAEVLGMLRKHWPTVRNTFARTPVAVVRAVLLDGLHQASSGDPLIAAAFTNTARNLLPIMELGDERAVWQAVIADLEATAGRAAEERWTTPATVTVPPLTRNAPRPVALRAEQLAALTTNVRAAIGPTDAHPKKARGEPKSNFSWPTGMSNPGYGQQPIALTFEPWANEVATRLAETLAGAITSAVNTAIEQSDLAMTEAVTRHVGDAVAAVGGALTGLEAQTRLLWWKESLYSPSARTSYRALPAPRAAALMAFDLYDGVGLTAPASVVALLSEAVAALDREQAYPVRTLVAAVPGGIEVADPAGGRVPLLALAGRGSFDDETFRRRTGVPAETRLTLPDWACWVFRELLAAGSAELSRSRRTGKA